MVSGFTADAIGKWAKASLSPDCAVIIDGLGCFAAVTAAGCIPARVKVLVAYFMRPMAAYPVQLNVR
jgi:hypothetical protein